MDEEGIQEYAAPAYVLQHHNCKWSIRTLSICLSISVVSETYCAKQGASLRLSSSQYRHIAV